MKNLRSDGLVGIFDDHVFDYADYLKRMIIPGDGFTNMFLNPMNFAAVSFNIKAAVSVENDLEKSLPSTNCHPTVFP